MLTVHPESTLGFPLPDGPSAYLRCMAAVYDPCWPMLSTSSSLVLIYSFALRSWDYSLILQDSASSSPTNLASNLSSTPSTLEPIRLLRQFHQGTLPHTTRANMCYQVVERYSVCRCLYYQHAVDPCAAHGQRGHMVQEKTVLVGYTCGRPGHGSHRPQAVYHTGVLPDSGYGSAFSTPSLR